MQFFRPFWIRVLAALCAAPIILASSQGWAASQWPEERTAGPFVFHADFSLANHAGLVAEIAQLQRDLVHSLAVGECRESVHLFLFARRRTYEGYLSHYFPRIPYRRALFVKRRGPGMVFAHLNPEFAVDVRHETTHALLHACMTHVPLWLDEGLAEYFEVPPHERAYSNPHAQFLRRKLLLGHITTIKSLEQLQNLEQMGATQYCDAWSWVHFMLHGPAEAHDELVRYLDDIQNAVPAGQLSDRLRRRLPDLERQYLKHFHEWVR